MSGAKVKIATVAANEGPYLAQWIYHHHYFGFDAFDIYVNNTTDNTMDILDKLKSWYPDIHVHNMDWINVYFGDKKPYCAMQNLTYLQDYYNARNFDYVLFIDLDEFWQPSNGSDKIQNCIENLNWPDCIFFHWFFLDGLEQYLVPIFAARKMYGRKWRTIKTCLRTGLKPTELTIHFPRVKYMKNVVVGNGGRHIMQRKEPWALHPEQAKVEKDYFIVHDSARTLVNFLSKIIRGHISKSGNADPTKRLAHDRPMPLTMSSHKSTTLTTNLPHEYYIGFKRMFQKLDLYEPMRQAKIHECLKALECLRYLAQHPDISVTVRLVQQKGSLESLHDEIFALLTGYEGRFNDCACAAFARPEQLAKGSAEHALAAFLPALRLYPYAKDEAGTPIFLKALIEYILDKGEFGLARRILADKELASNKAFGDTWAWPLFAKEYEKRKMRDEALKLYGYMEYSFDKAAWEAADKLAKVPV